MVSLTETHHKNTKNMINITIRKEGLDLSMETLAMMRRVVAKVEKQVACVMVIEEAKASQEPQKKLKKSPFSA